MKLAIFILFLFTSLFASDQLFLNDLTSLKTSDDRHQYIYLIRHGESIFNLPDKNGMYYTQGQSISAPLTENGERQAVEIAKKLQEKILPNTQIVTISSTAIRAYKTAYCIFQTLSGKCNVQLGDKYPDLLEISKGKWEGLPKDEIFYQAASKWNNSSELNQWHKPQVPTAESFANVAKRAIAALEEIINKHQNQTIFIVSHGGTLTVIEHYLKKTQFSDDPHSNFPKFKFHNCDMLILKIPKGKGIEHAEVEFFIKSGFPNTYK